MTSQPPAIEVAELAKSYGDVVALDDVSLHVNSGEAVGLLGPNGAGKSTLVKILCGLVFPTSGEAHVAGQPAGSLAARSAIGYLAELFRFPGWLTVREVVQFHQRLARSDGGTAEVDELVERVGMTDAANRRVHALSKGMQQRLGVAQALVGNPPVVILDEPTSALDPGGRRMVRELVQDLRSDGRAILLSSHLLAEVEQLCDRVLILSQGSVVADGTVDELAAAPAVTVVTDQGTERHLLDRASIPELVADMVAAGREIYEVRPDANRLEEAYLELVQER